MAGMLPGVECARRRRMHQAGGPTVESAMGSRRSSFCLYAAGHEPHHYIGSLQRNHLYKIQYNVPDNAELDHAARVAKERLDGRLGIQRAASDSRRKVSSATAVDGGAEKDGAATVGLQIEVFCSRKKKKKKKKGRNIIGRLGWTRVAGWLPWPAKKDIKSRAEWGNDEDEDDECAVCLDDFRDGEELAGLRCGHRFHKECALRWLRNSDRCPCCRTGVSV